MAGRGIPDSDKWVLQDFRPKLTAGDLRCGKNILKFAMLIYKKNSQTDRFISIFAIFTELAFLYGSEAQ